jgi:hypothetical protein
MYFKFVVKLKINEVQGFSFCVHESVCAMDMKHMCRLTLYGCHI